MADEADLAAFCEEFERVRGRPPRRIFLTFDEYLQVDHGNRIVDYKLDAEVSLDRPRARTTFQGAEIRFSGCAPLIRKWDLTPY